MSDANESRYPASSLDLSDEALAELSKQTSALVMDYFKRVAELAVFPDTSAGETIRRLGSELPMEGDPIEKILNDCRAIFDFSRHNGHPRFFGYVASPATAPGAFADLMASSLNANVTSWRSSPAATEVEQLVIRWLGTMVGFSENASGFLTSGGSLANLNALLIAQRAHTSGDVGRSGLWKISKPQTIYVSDQIHMSITKAADILGFGRDQVRVVPSDERFRIDIEALRKQIAYDAENGAQPFCVVASAGTVNTGAVDPLDQVAAVAREFKLWFHIDGAYGALAAIDENKRKLFKGIEEANSLSLDAHKWLYTPIDAGCLLLRDLNAARRLFSANEADYIKNYEQTDQESFAFWDYGVELSRRFRALKIWLTLRYFGTRRIGRAISEDLALAAYLSDEIEKSDDFELLAPAELSICCFRYLPKKYRRSKSVVGSKHLDEINSQVMHAVQRGGEAYLSNATIGGRFALRTCITNFRTTRADIDQTLEVIRNAARELGYK